jgi:hypothetical protein
MLVLPFSMSAPALATFVLAAGGVWGISRLPLRVLPRLALSASWLAVLVAARAGMAGPALAARLRVTFGIELFLWSLVLLRSWLLQMERDALEPHQRSFPAFFGGLGLFALGGAVHGAPMTHATLHAPHRAAPAGSVAWRGVGLLALALAYGAVVKLASPPLLQPFTGLRPAAAADALGPYLAAQTPGRLWLALVLYWPLKYVAIAARLFFLVGNLRLLGFDVPAGFRQPFLSRNFVDLWRRWNHYVRDAAMVLFFFPAMGALRRRVPPALAQAGAVLLSFSALIFLDVAIRPAFEQPIVVPRGDYTVQAARLAVIGGITAATAWWAVRRGRTAEPTGWRRAVAIAVTVTVAGAISTGAAVLGAGLSAPQLAELTRFLIGG